ncbi:iron complex outermembrane recepter protein [Flavobacteriaceae bacterium MAR_2010_188]|nr:iron complex outermembrane recepter protein [Flavobacteriaceae bacterium MAR_2010_188]
MKLSFLILILTLYSFSLLGQSQFSSRILDAQNQFPIANAVVMDDSSSVKSTSDRMGYFSIATFGKLTIQANGYLIRTIKLEELKTNLIFLQAENTNLDEILINASNIPQKQRLSVQAVSSIGSSELKIKNSHDLSAVLNTIPGVFMQSATLNTNKITIRGIGARNLFGTANIRAYFGDIPLTDGNGESAIEDLELRAISNITILKGPSSSTYGVGLGGAIILAPKFNDFTSSNVSASFEIGSFGFQKSILTSEVGLKKAGLNFTFSNTQSDGYRDNNQYDRNTATISSKVYLSDKDDLTFIGSFIDLKGGIPSSLSLEDYQNSPQKASFTWNKAQAYEDLEYGIFGLSWKHDFNSNNSLLTSANTSFKNNYEPRPFNILQENLNSLALRSRFLGNLNSDKLKLEYSLGGEIFYDFYLNKTFENLYDDFSDNRGSVAGNQLSGFKERRNYINFFGEAILNLSEKLRINTGLNINTTNFKVEDEFTNASLANNGEFQFKSILSPKIGFSYDLNKELVLYASAAHGFSTPTTAETLLPDGEFNPNLKPETGWNLETGLRYYLLDNMLFGSFSLYKMYVNDLLVSRRTQQDDFFAINAGKAELNGAELELNYQFFKTADYQLLFSSGISLHDYKFKDFVDFENDFSNNKIAGVPSSVLNFELKLYSEKGFYGRIGYQTVGEIAVNDANSEFNNSYNLLNALLAYKLLLSKSFVLDLHASGNNILDEKYASQVQVNAVGFGSNAPRFYYPGLPFNYYTGASIKFNF